VEAKCEHSERATLLLVAFLLVNAPNCHLSLVLALVVQGDAVNCNNVPRVPHQIAPMHSSDYHGTWNSNYRRNNLNRNALRSTCRVSAS